eukprot:3819984-Amphidinium_carterae.1
MENAPDALAFDLYVEEEEKEEGSSSTLHANNTLNILDTCEKLMVPPHRVDHSYVASPSHTFKL